MFKGCMSFLAIGAGAVFLGFSLMPSNTPVLEDVTVGIVRPTSTPRAKSQTKITLSEKQRDEMFFVCNGVESDSVGQHVGWEGLVRYSAAGVTEVVIGQDVVMIVGDETDLEPGSPVFVSGEIVSIGSPLTPCQALGIDGKVYPL